MVLWEITLATAYFLGLKRTYKLALRIQRRLIGSNHPKIREFVQRRTRMVFDVAISVHQNIQARDIEVGRNIGNWILRYLDQMKPSARIRGPPSAKSHGNINSSMTTSNQAKKPSYWKSPGSIETYKNEDSGRRMFTSSRLMWSRRFPTISMMMRSAKPAGNMTQYRHVTSTRGLEGPSSGYPGERYGGVIRKDIMQWMQN
ncbi:hypothetical protein MLD38_020814 [Melastoma candidum]|uniref:Uncharacterized protein n=1 Tax=Melastoma candidum TaxID=119954 RepID=A0ACB9QEL9_9MYRT|nr:hypothetical protein MLD38_020814 [Melastoma candidum]